ncbi:flagellar hook protein FlgE [Acidocella facilis]|uniref:flagellar hook protein FlgE n=1 Tax=Acidocella facilis TaxID=525 RepID=UPI001F264202|nr:flagellar hook protein FlgE [Acidocella facilis]
MSLQTALSGLDAAQTGLNTVSNDLANASTTAFKSQTSLFEDVYPTGETGVPGYGAATEGMDTNISQGGLTSTGNGLDAAIQGNGYFVVSNNGTQQYTRDGAFKLSSDGTLQTLTGSSVMGYTGAATSGTLSALSVSTGAMKATASANLGVDLDLNSGDTQIPATTAFNAADATTYSESTSTVAYDSLGNANTVKLYMVQNQATGGATPSWTVYAQPVTSAGTNVGSAQQLTTLNFNTDGTLASGSPATLNVNWGNGAANSALSFNFAGTSLAAQNFAVAGLTNDGYAAGTYSGSSVNSSGQLVSTYSNGQTITNGTLALANFINPEGLQDVSGNLYASTNSSGVAVVNAPGNGQSGTVEGGYLEASNASTSSLLVSLIQYQQAYQADTSVLQTEQQDAQRLVQI